MIRPRCIVLAAALFVAAAPARAAQSPDAWDPGRILVTRVDLEDLLRRLEATAASPAYSQSLRDRARAEAVQIRARLADGDFRVGDRITLVVATEATLTDTFDVREGRVLRLPMIGDVPLSGVLRSELEEHLRAAIGRFIKDPEVHARSLIRLSLLGEVARPGYYAVPTDMVLSDALMLAGGPTGSAKLTKIRIERSGAPIMGNEGLQQAIAQGRTIEQLSLRAGDQVVVPRKGGGLFSEPTMRTVSILLTLPVAIYGLAQLF
jgi:polysaccharide export outer membrane protein